jgi:hypothetical protein
MSCPYPKLIQNKELIVTPDSHLDISAQEMGLAFFYSSPNLVKALWNQTEENRIIGVRLQLL